MTVSTTGNLARTIDVIDQGTAEGLHVGAQLHVSLGDEVVADVATGIAAEGVEMTPDTMMIWWSSTKAATAVAAMQAWERGAFDLDDPVARHIEEFGQKGKGAITVRHLLTHTAGIRNADRFDRFLPFQAPWDEVLRTICEAEPEPGWVPGRKAGYHPTSTLFLLAELVRRHDGRDFPQYVREEVFAPAGMTDSWIGIPPERYRAYGERIGIMHNTEEETPRPMLAISTEDVTAACVPGGNGRGPIRELALLYRALLRRGEGEHGRLLSPQAVEALTARHRAGMHDETFGIVIDWSLGLILDSVLYGRHCSPRTFGHGGARSSVGFCDPEHGLVVTLVCNGMPVQQDHYRRQQAISSAIYEDLGLTDPRAEGKDHPVPSSALL